MHKLNLRLLSRSKPDERNVLLCIDFGTALSKAAASRGHSGYRPLLLPLGQTAKDPTRGNRYLAQSSLFVSRERTLHFGHDAVDKWSRQREFAIGRLDSMKRWLSTGPIDDLDTQLVEAEYLPQGASFTKGHALTLVLAYVTDLAGRCLQSADRSRYVHRRFTRPVWDGERGAWSDREMVRLLGRAQIVADTFSGKWDEGISLGEAQDIVQQAAEQEIPQWVVQPAGVLEPIAAGHARLEKDYSHRSVALVVDVGAGTTDLAVFAAIQRDGETGLARAVPQGVPRGLNKAGDYLDGVLRELILRDVARGNASDVVHREAEGQARVWKESLFLDGLVRPTFRGGIIGPVIRLVDFLNVSDVRAFQTELKQAVDDVLESVKGLTDLLGDSTYHPLDDISVVATGGGARLPMVTRLATGARSLGRHRFIMRDLSATPSWFERHHPDDLGVFQQLAVAIGGSFPKLPGGPPDPSSIRRRLSL